MKKIILLFFITLSLFGDDPLSAVLKQSSHEISVVLFYTKWCPPCKRSVDLLNEVSKSFAAKVQVVGVEVLFEKNFEDLFDDSYVHFQNLKLPYKDLEIYNIGEGVPVILLLDSEYKLIKIYRQEVQKRSFISLLQRVQDGFLANGVPPAAQRVDLWKNNRRYE